MYFKGIFFYPGVSHCGYICIECGYVYWVKIYVLSVNICIECGYINCVCMYTQTPHTRTTAIY